MAAGAYILAPEGPSLSPDERAFFRDADPCGFILFERNAKTPRQLAALTADLRDCVGRDAPILIDQEGGRVQRLWPPFWRRWRPPLEDAGLGPRAFWLRGRLIAAELSAAGIDVNCAPMADIARPDTHHFLRNRCYGRDAETVVAHARALADGQAEGGVLSVLKHAPGHGRARADSHLRLPVIDADLDELHGTDFAPFEALADLPFVMTAHLLMPALDPGQPVTLSPEGILFLREELGLDGFLMTDDISMEALDGDVGTRAARALAAGCDAVLHCNGELDEMRAIAEAAGPLSPPAAQRLKTALDARRAPQAADLDALDDELRRMLEGDPHA